ncbi:ABC transporter permease [Tyzzerella sp. OttesenSCG-928-J15]|nr:ABC transporter permease [Tyzzerella sp. OttesenSCG-928-J15]
MKTFFSKLAAFISSLIIISLIVFFVFQILPGDPALIILGADADPNQLEALRESLGLNLPLAERYINWVKGALTGDFGTSIRYNIPVSQLIMSRLPVTAALGLMAIAMSIIIGLFFGIVISKYRNSPFGHILSLLTQLGLAIPTFWLGIMLMLIFSVILNIFPSGRYISIENDFWGFWKSLFLPALALAIGNGVVIVRFLKSSVESNMEKDYVRTAKSRGSSNNRILFVHVLRNACLPVITIIGMIAAETLSGSIIVENVFSLPGLGQLIVTSIATRDLPLVQATCLYIAFIVVSINFIVDGIYKIADPRLRGQ